jgi:6-phosphogluconolactonase (cycloisomerase 2 family)
MAASGLVTGITQGSTAISAALPFSPISASSNLTVAYQPPSSISLHPGSVLIPLGDAQQFAAVVTFADGNSLDWTAYVTWSSSDPSVAVSAGQGRVTSVSLGSATVTASLGSILGSATLTVSPLVPNQARFAYVANFDSTLSLYRVDGSTGILTPNGTLPLGDSVFPNSLAADPQHKFLYTANLNNFSISAFAIDPAAGTLSALSGSPFSAQLPWTLAVDPSSRFLYVASGPGSSLTYSLDASGIPTYVAQTPQASGGAIGIAIAPSGKFVYTANVNANTVSFYGVDATSGALTLAGQVATGPNPGSIVLDPLGKFLFVPNKNGQSVSVYSIDPNTGVPTVVPGSPFATGQIPDAVSVHPSGNFAYVVNQASNSISAFTVDSSGVLSPIPGSPFAIPDGSGPAAASVDPLGKWLYIVNQSTNNVSFFAIDSASGALTSQGSIATGANPISIVLTQ